MDRTATPSRRTATVERRFERSRLSEEVLAAAYERLLPTESTLRTNSGRRVALAGPRHGSRIRARQDSRTQSTGRLHAARQGSVSVLSGAPYGCRYVSCREGDGEARYEIVLEEARVVRQMFEWVGRDATNCGW
jgi:hypothetical protein